MEKKIEQLKKDYEEFIDLAAHDLDAPLRKLSVLVDRVAQKCQKTGDEELQPYLDRIESCLADMRSMIDGLSMLSKTISGPMTNEPCDTESLIRDLARELETLANPKKVLLTSADLPIIIGDPGQCRQLFKSLFQNSIRYNAKDPVEIKVDCRPATPEEKTENALQQDKGYSAITVSDNGIGFKQEFAEKIFKPFVRLHGKSEYPGKGLGLALCKKIAENHEGVIYAQGKENEGARFVVILPQTID
jgi:signal transduction histidine kinase